MSTKIIAIGNKLMKDDGVALHTAEYLKNQLDNSEIEVIIGETDFQYCLKNINPGDYIIIIDATCFGVTAGTITAYPIELFLKSPKAHISYSQHGFSLFNLLAFYNNIKGIVLGIEGEKFEFGLDMSCNLKSTFDSVCKEIHQIILDNIKPTKHKLPL